MKFKLTLSKRIVIIILFAIITSIPVAFFSDALFSGTEMTVFYAGTIGYILVSAGVGYFIIQDSKIKPKSLFPKCIIFAGTMVLYVLLAWAVFFGFVYFSYLRMLQSI